ncbi:MAG: hypothetical protein DRI46_10335 [Chloroflexi bacterium]|nr:MAG: hypothetical protein DRI46_10335 [Chloroflexota bacterium]
MARRKLDAYMTQQAMVLPLFAYVPIKGLVLEPCAGKGAIVQMLHWHPSVDLVLAADIDAKYGWRVQADATDPLSIYYRMTDIGPATGKMDWIVTNPPFNKAAEILEVAWDSGIPNIAMLLTTGRNPYRGRKGLLKQLSGKLSYLMPFGSPRPSFTGNGKTDSTTVAWFVWQRKHKGGTTVITVPDWQMDNVQEEHVIDAAVPLQEK